MRVKRTIVEIVDLSEKIGCLFLPRLRFLWRFACGHEELRSHRTQSGNGAVKIDGKWICRGWCRQCSCC